MLHSIFKHFTSQFVVYIATSGRIGKTQPHRHRLGPLPPLQHLSTHLFHRIYLPTAKNACLRNTPASYWHWAHTMSTFSIFQRESFHKETYLYGLAAVLCSVSICSMPVQTEYAWVCYISAHWLVCMLQVTALQYVEWIKSVSLSLWRLGWLEMLRLATTLIGASAMTTITSQTTTFLCTFNILYCQQCFQEKQRLWTIFLAVSQCPPPPQNAVVLFWLSSAHLWIISWVSEWLQVLDVSACWDSESLIMFEFRELMRWITSADWKKRQAND